MPIPAWLPEMFQVDPWTGETFEALYEVFRADFIATRPSYLGQEVWYFPEVEDGKLEIFWHLTAREDKERGERLPDYRRAERLPWAHPLIDHHLSDQLLAWNYEEGDGDIHTYIWLQDGDYLIILKRYPNGDRRIITAHWIQYAHKRNSLMKKYKRRVLEGQ